MYFSVPLSCQTATSCREACDDSELAKVSSRDSAVLGNQGNTVPRQPGVTCTETARDGLCSSHTATLCLQSTAVADLTPRPRVADGLLFSSSGKCISCIFTCGSMHYSRFSCLPIIRIKNWQLYKTSPGRTYLSK